MATFEIKRTIFLTPNSRSEGVKAVGALPNRVTLRKGERFEGQIVRSNQPNIESTLIFDYGGYHFEKPYGGTDVYANMNARDLVVFMPQGALVGTPQEGRAIVHGSPTTRPMEGGNSILAGEINPNNPTSTITKSTSGMSMFQFKSKLHAGVTLVGVAFGVYYAYKTKASVGKYIGYALGAGAVGFILGSVASSFATQTPVKQLKEQNTPTADLAKPNPMPPIAKVNTSVESGTMTNQMNLIL
jgi:hypothetical protein